jgi:GT2 family glycosyltransferase
LESSINPAVSISEYKISIIIVTYNSLPPIQFCLAHLREGAKRIKHELIIIDNNSTDNTPSAAKNLWPEAEIMINRKNAGFAAACNLGAKRAQGDYLLFLNPDVYIDTNCIEELLNFVYGKEKVGAVGGRMRFPDSTFQASCRNLPTMGNLIFSRGSILGKFFRLTGSYTLPDRAIPVEVPALAGAMLLIRNDVFEKAGRFDPRFFLYMEDTDLCKRLTMLGFCNYFVPSAGAVHEWGKGSSSSVFKRIWHHHNSVFKYFRKHKRGAVTYLALPIMLMVNFVLVTLLNVLRFSKK